MGDDRYCIEVLNQIITATHTLRQVAPGGARRPHAALRLRSRPHRPDRR
ncbi:hypothetical protein [Streptomyces fildesensis]